MGHGGGSGPLCATRSVVHRAKRSGSRRHAQHLLLVLVQVVHIQAAVRLQPVLVHSTASARISRKQLSALGKIRTAWVRRLISSFRRSSGFVDLRCFVMLAGQPMCSSTQPHSLGKVACHLASKPRARAASRRCRGVAGGPRGAVRRPVSSPSSAPAQSRVSITLITAGPIRTMNSTGRMNTIMGTVRVAGRRAAFSSAFSSR
jgi:hypothetical protein